jgi:hypothetical protein
METVEVNRTRHYRRPPSPRLTIPVDEDRIDEAVRRDSRHCWIAEAISAVVPDMTAITVDLQTIRFTDPAKRLRYAYLTPRSCHIALIEFDQGERPAPFLGAAMIFAAPDRNKHENGIPVVVGGRPTPGNIVRTRRFGLRELRA